MKIRISERAARELNRQLDWLEALSPTAARNARQALYEALQRLLEYPSSGPQITRRQRRLVVRFGRDGFIIRYHVDREFVSINRVLHGRQNR